MPERVHRSNARLSFEEVYSYCFPAMNRPSLTPCFSGLLPRQTAIKPFQRFHGLSSSCLFFLRVRMHSQSKTRQQKSFTKRTDIQAKGSERKREEATSSSRRRRAA